MGNQTQTRLDGGVKTLVGHCRNDSTDIYIGRGDHGDAHLNNTPIGERGWLGNPYPKDDHGRAECIDLFRSDFEARLESDPEFKQAVAELAGQTLGCWCQRAADDGPACHGEVIATHADRLAMEGDDA